MIINDTKLASFKSMIKNFADRNDIGYDVRTTTNKKTTEVDLGTIYKYRNYVVEWDEAPNLSEAAARIFADAIHEFKLKDNITTSFDNPSFEIKDVIVFKKWIPEEVHSDAVTVDLADFEKLDTGAAVGQINKFCDKMKKIFGGENT